MNISKVFWCFSSGIWLVFLNDLINKFSVEKLAHPGADFFKQASNMLKITPDLAKSVF